MGERVFKHRLIPLNHQLAEVVDVIQAEPGKHLWQRMFCELLWLNLPSLFAYCGWITRRALEVSR